MRLPVVSFRRFAQLAAALAFSGCAGEAGVMNRGSVDAGTSQDAGVVSTQDAGGAGAVDAG